MDIFIEEMVKKKKTAADSAMLLGMTALAVILVIFLFMVVMPMFAQFSSIILLVVVGIIYAVYMLSANFNLEYEYSLVNSEIDIDRIAGKKRRKRLTTVNLKNLDAFGKRDNSEYDRCMRDSGIKKIFACRDKNADDVYFLAYTDGSERRMLIFSPSERITAVVEKLNPKR